MPPAKHQVGIDGMVTSDQRHEGTRLEGRLDDLALERQREIGAVPDSTGWGNGIQDDAHYLG